MSNEDNSFVVITMAEDEVARLVRAADRQELDPEPDAAWPSDGPCSIRADQSVPYGDDDLHSVLISGELDNPGFRQVVIVTTDPGSPDRSFNLDPRTGFTSNFSTHPPGDHVPPRMALRDRFFVMNLIRLLASNQGVLSEPEKQPGPNEWTVLLNNEQGKTLRWKRTTPLPTHGQTTTDTGL